MAKNKKRALLTKPLRTQTMPIYDYNGFVNFVPLWELLLLHKL
jgi:hypothetical protein